MIKINDRIIGKINSNPESFSKTKTGAKLLKELGGDIGTLSAFAQQIQIMFGDINKKFTSVSKSKLTPEASRRLTQMEDTIKYGVPSKVVSESYLNSHRHVIWGMKKGLSADKSKEVFSEEANRKRVDAEKVADIMKQQKEVERLAKIEELFSFDMMDDYDKDREVLKRRYQGDSGKASAMQRHNILRQLPEFFKNSKLSTKELYKIAGYAKVFPRVAKLAQFGAAHPALLAAQGIRMAYQYGMKNLMESVGSYVSATASGLSYSGAIFGGSALSGFGGSAADRFASAGSWYGNVGEILMGGGIEKLVALDRFGINPMGSGSGGFATEEEILVRIAKQLPKWDKSRQLALKNNPMIKISDPMFAAMLAHPNDFQQYLHRNDYMKAWGVGDEEVPAAGIRQATKWGDANAAWSGFGGQVGLAFESTSDILADLWKGAGLASTKGMQWFNKADRAFTGVWKDFWFNWFDGPSNERSILHAIFGSDNPSNAAKNAAVSSDVYDSNGGSAGSQTTNDNSRSVTINVNGMTVQSNNAEGVVKGLADMSGTYDPTALATANDPGGY